LTFRTFENYLKIRSIMEIIRTELWKNMKEKFLRYYKKAAYAAAYLGSAWLVCDHLEHHKISQAFMVITTPFAVFLMYLLHYESTDSAELQKSTLRKCVVFIGLSLLFFLIILSNFTAMSE
jgi:hypothetical protein